MYPPIKVVMIKIAVNFFSKIIMPSDKQMMHKCFDLILFGISSTHISFNRYYYECHVRFKKYQWLAIGE